MMKIIHLLSFLVMSLILQSVAVAAECVSKDGEAQLSFTQRENGETTEGADHNTTGSWIIQGLEIYKADCVPQKKLDQTTTRYGCYMEPEWDHFVLTTVIDMKNDHSSAILHSVAIDRRYTAGYRIEASIDLTCR